MLNDSQDCIQVVALKGIKWYILVEECSSMSNLVISNVSASILHKHEYVARYNVVIYTLEIENLKTNSKQSEIAGFA